ncbi:MAG: LLM class flavin-dependent oxidoreductase [Dehalococcoidia bacterium]
MKIGLELGSEYPANRPIRPLLEQLLEQTALARDYGFDCVLLGQHYLSSPLQILQPLPLLGRLAAEAGEMWLGTGILLLPLLHPVDVAEQIVTLDTICDGRFIFGVGLGYEEEEFRAFGLDRRDRVARFEESLEIIKRLWTQDSVTYHGKHFSLTDVTPTARPIQRPHPPVWIAANNHPAVRRAARIADGWYASPHAVFATLEEQMRIYREALAEAGVPDPHYIPVLRDTYVAETDEQALRDCRPFLEGRYQVYGDQGQDRELPAGDRFDMSFEELARDRFIIGAPDTCVREIKRYQELGFNYIILEYQWPGMGSELAMRCLRLLGEEVLPRLRQGSNPSLA